jgi:hypothetical protein
MTRGQFLTLVAVWTGLVLFLGLNAPLSEGLSIGGDDGFELCKAQLLARQPEMAARLHNDQPWLLTLVVAQFFRLLGEDAAIPRLFSLGFTLTLVFACWHVMGKGCSMLEGALFLCVLFTSREVPTLVTSAMLEPAAMSLGVLAVACGYSWRGPVGPWRGFLSGGAAGPGCIHQVDVFAHRTRLVYSALAAAATYAAGQRDLPGRLRFCGRDGIGELHFADLLL